MSALHINPKSSHFGSYNVVNGINCLILLTINNSTLSNADKALTSGFISDARDRE